MFWCQFLSAFNDNALKNGLVFLLLWGSWSPQAGWLVPLAGGVFIAPYFLLSALGGELADRFDKAWLAVRLKAAEIAVAALAVCGMLAQSVPVLFAALFGFGCISALFGPLKYAILPDHLPRERLLAANALVEFATFAAILLGTLGGGIAALPAGRIVLGLVILLAALLCLLAARAIPATGAADPGLHIHRNVAISTRNLLRALRARPTVWAAALANNGFWLVGSLALTLSPLLIRHAGGGAGAVTAGLLVFSVGIGAGSAAAARIGRGRISLRPGALGAAGMGLALFDLAWTIHGQPARAAMPLLVFLRTTGNPRLLADLLVLAAAGGLLAVPSFTALQHWAPVEERARMVAGANVLSSLAILAGAGLAGAAPLLGTPGLLIGLGIGCLAVAAGLTRHH